MGIKEDGAEAPRTHNSITRYHRQCDRGVDEQARRGGCVEGVEGAAQTYRLA
jgi:hypothetical protein